MDSRLTRPGHSTDRLLAGLIPIALAALLSAGACAKAPLAIVAPTTDTVVIAGTSLTVAVEVRRTSLLLGVAVVGDDPLGTTNIHAVSSKKLTFSLRIPRDTAPGPYRLWAVTAEASGVPAESPEIRLFVEPSDAPRALTAYPPRLKIHALGQAVAWAVIGTFADGSELDVTKSRHLRVTSENPGVATADHGWIKARSSGSTILDLRYGSARQRIPITVSSAPGGAGDDQ